MGNRAAIVLKNDTDKDARGVYVQWNGGEGSIAAFVEETKRRMACRNDDLYLETAPTFGFKNEVVEQDRTRINNNTCVSFYAVLHGVIRDFFNYSGSFKSRDARSVYLTTDLRNATEDNGCYLINDDFTCDRYSPDSLVGYEKECYEFITDYFEAVHHALSAVVDDEERTYEQKTNQTVDSLTQELAYAEELVRTAKLRYERLKRELDKQKQEE